MAAPLDVVCTKDQWTKVADGVTEGMVWIKNTLAKYRHTYVAAGGAAPTGLDNSLPLEGAGLPISVDVASDVYIMATGRDGEVTVAL